MCSILYSKFKEILNVYLPLLTILAIFVVFLAACNDSSSDLSDINKEEHDSSGNPIAILAFDTKTKTVADESKTIELSQLVKVSDNSDFSLVSVVNKSGSCQVELGNKSFDVKSKQLDDCILQYHVQSTRYPKETASAFARIGVNSTYSDPSLPIINKDADVGIPVNINIRNELSALGTDITDAMLSSNIVVVGSGTASIISSDTVEFNAVGHGISQIYYSYRNATQLFQGVLVMSMSDEGSNHPPTAMSYVYPQKLSLGEEITIDIETLGLISDLDGDELQLTEISGFDSDVSLYEPLNVTNTSFTFSAMQPGQHNLVYVVSDHQGGFDTGSIIFNIELDFSLVQPWDDIIIPADDSPWGVDTTFIAPPSQALLDLNNIDYDSFLIGDGVNAPIGTHIAQLSTLQARNYCANRGARLPTSDELIFLESYFSSEIGSNLYTSQGWPIMSSFLSGDFGDVGKSKSFSFTDRNFNVSSAAAFVTCVLLDNDEIKDYYAIGDIKYDAGVDSILSIKTYSPYNDIAPFYTVNVKAINNKGLFDNALPSIVLSTDSGGMVKTTYHDVSFNDEDLNVEMSLLLNIIPYKADISLTDIDVTIANADMWDIRNIRNTYTGLTLDGMPIQYSSNTTVALSYQQSFRGENFIAFYRMLKTGNRNYGNYSFYIQQVSPDPNLWYTQINNDGYPSDRSVYGFNVSYYDSSFRIIKEGSVSQDDILRSSYIRSNYNYVWFDKRGQELRIYSSETDIRPEYPISVVDIKLINLEEDYWIGFSGFNNIATSGIVEKLNFAAYSTN